VANAAGIQNDSDEAIQMVSFPVLDLKVNEVDFIVAPAK
jgi:hypothetical protein